MCLCLCERVQESGSGGYLGRDTGDGARDLRECVSVSPVRDVASFPLEDGAAWDLVA